MNGLSRIPARPDRLLPTSIRVPAESAADRKPYRAPFAAALLTIGSLALSSCAETGDFGRPRAGVWNDVVLPRSGAWAAAERGEFVSAYPLTDLEEELRDRSWRYLMPAHERQWFDRTIADLARTRVLPANRHPSDPTSYYGALIEEGFVSPASRFRRIGEDAEADLRLIVPFAAVSQRVIEADRARLRSLAFVRDLDHGQIHEAMARVVENRCLIAWVRAETHERTEAYRYALEHAFVAMPQNEAAGAERAVKALDVHRRILDALPVPLWHDGTCIEPPALERAIPRARRAPVVKG
jgi:hypothetical protein